MNDQADRTAIWADLLDELERVIEAQARSLAAEGDLAGAPAFEPPEIVPPLPPALAARALDLSERSAAVLALARELADRTQPLEPPRRHHRTRSCGSSIVFDELA